MGTQATSSVCIRPARRPTFFYATVSVLAVIIAFVGFARTYYLKAFFGSSALPMLLHVHGIVMTTWLALFVAQTTLVAARRTDIHRRLGVIGGGVAISMIVLGVTVAIRAVRAGHAPAGGSPLAFLVIPLGDMFVFTMLIAAGFYFRRRPEIHKRLMLIATIAVLAPAIARWPLHLIAHQPLRFFAVADVILIACVVYDYAKTRRLHPAFVWGGLLLIASHPLRIALSTTPAWTMFARWITGM